MNKKIPAGAMLMSSVVMLMMLGMTAVKAQTPFFQAVTNLHPLAYWPLQETIAPPAADVENNLGTLGAVADAFYSSTNAAKGAAGVTGDGDAAVSCGGNNGAFLAVPVTDKRVSLPAGGPFSVEIWVNPANTAAATIIAQTGPSGSGGVNAGPDSAGWSLSQNYIASQNNNNLTGWCFHVYNGAGIQGAEAISVLGFAAGTWYHLVGVFDGTNAYLYVDGVNSSASSPINGTFVPDTWDPLTIGCGRGLDNNQFMGTIDEVAIYTNALTQTQIQNHYNNIYSSYSTIVLADNPYMYWRMDAPAYTPSGTLPTATDYGALGDDGQYSRGTVPGVAGPAPGGLGSPSYGVGINGINSAVVVPYSASLNLATNPFAIAFWYKANPQDNRSYQRILSNSDDSWNFNISALGFLRFNPGSGSDLVSNPIYSGTGTNAGKWHFAVGVYTNSGTADSGMNYLYVDGVLAASATNGIYPDSLGTNDAFLGGAPDYTDAGDSGGYNQRYFDGSIAQVAIFTNALSADQIQALYSAAQPPPVIIAQPAATATALGGETNALSATVSGASTLAYQWYFNTSPTYSGATALSDTVDGRISGSTTASLTITNLGDADTGYYYLVVNNAYGSVTSILSQVTVYATPVITAQSPAGAFSMFVGQDKTLSVTAVGAPALTYQWYTNGVADTAAGTDASYALAGVQVAQSGETYQCVVGNSYGSTTGVVATLTVQSLPSSVTTSTYASSILALNPTVYYPMHEAAAPAPADIETNYGSLGALGTAYYADWNANGGAPGNSVVTHQVSGALPNDPDPCVGFSGTTTSYLMVPHTVSATLLQPPFTVEFWVKPFIKGANNFGDIMGDGGSLGNSSGTDGNQTGMRFYYNNQHITIYMGNGTGQTSFRTPGNTVTIGTWHHIVLTCDADRNFVLYQDGSSVNSGFVPLAPNIWNPFVIGASFWQDGSPTRFFLGDIDEVAVYTNELSSSDVYAHYNDGVSGGAGQYFTDVTNSGAVLYFRLNSPPFNGLPPSSTWPVMTNYGLAAVNGVYRPGLAPGSVSGPNNGAGLFNSTLIASNSAPMNGLSTFASVDDSGLFDVAYNEADPANDTPFTLLAWYRGNPTDPRFQSLVSHGQGSWQLNQDSYGRLQLWTSAGLLTANSYNDGSWHQVVAIHQGNTNTIYVDGAVAATAVDPAYTNGPGNTAQGLAIGADPSALDSPLGPGRQYAGDLCDVAFWKGTALEPAQVTALYDGSGQPPEITGQPVSATVNQNSIFTNTVLALGPAPLTYQWYENGAPRSGQTNADLVLNPVTAGDESTNWYVVVANNNGSVTSEVVSITVNSSPTIVSESPVSYTNLITLYAGASPTFSVAAIGAQPIQYQWRTNGVAVAGATGGSFTLDNVTAGLVNIDCVVSNFVGSTTSSVWALSVITAPTAPYPMQVLADKPVGYWRLNEGPDDGFGNDGVVSHDYWGGNNGIYTNVNLAQPGYNLATDPSVTSTLFGQTGISFIDSYVGEIEGIDFSSPTNTSSDFTIEAWVKGVAQTIDGAAIACKGYGNGGEQFDLDFYQSNYRFFVRDADGGVHGYTSTLTPDGLWHHVVGVCDESGGLVTLYIDGQAVGTAPITPGSGILASTNVMSIGARRSSLSATNYDFQYYGSLNDVAVYDHALSPDEVRAHWSAAGVPPVITEAPPSTVTLNEGGTLTLPAAAIGTPTLTNTWFDTFYFTNVSQTVVTGTNQTDATLVVSNVPVDWDFNTLQLTVANAFGSVSTNVTLTVISGPPVIVQDLPAHVTALEDHSYTYTVAAVGTEPFHYEWRFNGAPVAGQTASSYTFVSAPGNYSVVITNIFGAVTSTVSAMTVVAPPTDAYSSNIMTTLGAVGYWPLQETNAPVVATVETNLGTLGELGNAYYPTTNETDVVFGQTGALTGSGDTNPAVSVNGGLDSYAVVPRVSPALTMHPPVTMEAWINSASTSFNDIMGEGGNGLNSGDNSGNCGGIRMSYGGNYSGGPNLQVFLYTGNGKTRDSGGTPANTLPTGTWHHCVATYDGTTVQMYIDGQFQGSFTGTMAEDTWTPITIGAGLWYGDYPRRRYTGDIDEVAVYTNVLSAEQVNAHYQAGITPGSDYSQTVLNDNPLLYYRMDCPAYTNPPVSLSPTAVNYGLASVQGLYLSGTVPGGMPGPAYSGFGTNYGVALRNNGIFGCVDAGNTPAFNPTDSQPFTVMTWFRTYPSDNAVGVLMSHGAQNWALNLDGSTGRLVWNTYSGGQVTSTGVLNDGLWHFVAGVFDGVTNYLYVDGALDNQGLAAAGLSSEPDAELYLGGNSDYTEVGNERFFAGALANAAFFTNALTAAQIAQTYNLAGLAPGAQPAVSIQRAGAQLSITYIGRLLSSSNITGPYTPVAGAPVVGTSPNTITVSPSSERLFYRAVNP